MSADTDEDSRQGGHLFEHIADQLRTGVLTGKYQPGQRISEQEIAELFQVSRTPIREAFRLLHTEGVLSLLPNRGATVPKYDRRLIEDTIEVVECLEAVAGELACQRISDERVEQIDALTGRLQAAFDSGDHILYYKINRQIHDEIVAAAGNNVLLREHRKYNIRLYRTRFIACKHPPALDSAMRQHRKMVRLLRKRSGKKLGRLLRGHLSHTWLRAGIDPTAAPCEQAAESREQAAS